MGKIGTVLIVDDEALMLDMLSEMLKDKAEKVIPAQNGHEALELLSRIRFDIIITDMKMPGMNGIQLLESIRAIDPIIPVIVMTGYSETYGLEEAMKNGAEEYITKPFRKDEISIVIDRALWRASSKRRNILLRYIMAANEIIAESDKPDKEELLVIGKRLRQAIEASGPPPTHPVTNS